MKKATFTNCPSTISTIDNRLFWWTAGRTWLEHDASYLHSALIVWVLLCWQLVNDVFLLSFPLNWHTFLRICQKFVVKASFRVWGDLFTVLNGMLNIESRCLFDSHSEDYEDVCRCNIYWWQHLGTETPILENFAVTYDTDTLFSSDTLRHKILISCDYELDGYRFNIYWWQRLGTLTLYLFQIH